MANIRDWLEGAEATHGEPILAIVVGLHDRDEYKDEALQRPPMEQRNVLLTREEGLAVVDEDFDAGYGGADCYPITAWTASRVYFIHEYDGATSLSWQHRNPTAAEPTFN